MRVIPTVIFRREWKASAWGVRRAGRIVDLAEPRMDVDVAELAVPRGRIDHVRRFVDLRRGHAEQEAGIKQARRDPGERSGAPEGRAQRRAVRVGIVRAYEQLLGGALRPEASLPLTYGMIFSIGDQGRSQVGLQERDSGGGAGGFLGV